MMMMAVTCCFVKMMINHQFVDDWISLVILYVHHFISVALKPRLAATLHRFWCQEPMRGVAFLVHSASGTFREEEATGFVLVRLEVMSHHKKMERLQRCFA